MFTLPSRTRFRVRQASFVFFLAVFVPTLASAATVYVAVGGSDSGSCGAKDAPCRSISQGIANSAVGGSVVVGPGHYGDLDEDGTLGEAGEEPVPALCAIGDDCLIHVNKQVTVTSSAGAYATVIDPGPIVVEGSVYITAAGAAFGAANKGFTVIAPIQGGSIALLAQTAAPGAIVAGNLLVGHSPGSYGAAIYDGNQLLGNRIVVTTGGTGVYMGAGNTVSGNTVSGADFGAFVDGDGNQLSRNVLTGNIFGVWIDAGIGTTITESSILGNSNCGIFLNGPGHTGGIDSSNIVGNGTASTSNCGIDGNFSDFTTENVWWGDPSGPGADPADQTYDLSGIGTPASAAFKVKVKGIR